MHRAEMTFSTPLDWHQLAVFLAGLPIGGYQLIRMAVNGPPERPRVVLRLHVPTPARPLSELGEWLKDAAQASGLSPVELTLDAGPIRRRPTR